MEQEVTSQDYLNQINISLGTWGSDAHLSPQNMEEVFKQFEFNQDQEFLKDLIQEFCTTEVNDGNVMGDIGHRHGLQSMYVMSQMLKANPQVSIHQNELLVAALLHDYMATREEGSTSTHAEDSAVINILNTTALPKDFDSLKVLELINHTDYPNNGEIGLHNKKGSIWTFHFSATENKDALLMQLSDILGQMGNSKHYKLAIDNYQGIYPKAFKTLRESMRDITIPDSDRHIARAIVTQNTLREI